MEETFKIVTNEESDTVTGTVESLLAKREAQRRRGDTTMLQDLETAREVQQTLFPEAIPGLPGYDVAAHWRSCKQVGGDYYDFIPLGPSSYGIVVADVSGKGLSGAMIMVMTRSLFRQAARCDLSPRDTIIEVNKTLTKDIRRGLFVTALYGILEVRTNLMTVCSAGHTPPLLWRKTDPIKPQFIAPSGMVLGVMNGQAFADSLKNDRFEIQDRDRFLFYTDGVTEAVDEQGEEFGDLRLAGIMAERAESDSTAILSQVLNAVDAHRGTAPQNDDQTILVIGRQEGE